MHLSGALRNRKGTASWKGHFKTSVNASPFQSPCRLEEGVSVIKLRAHPILLAHSSEDWAYLLDFQNFVQWEKPTRSLKGVETYSNLAAC